MKQATQSVDFNDAAKKHGKRRVRNSIKAAIDGIKPASHASEAADTPHFKPHFFLTDMGVFYVGMNEDGQPVEPQFVCSPLKVDAKTRNSNNEEWGRLLTWTDADGHRHQWAAPAELLIGDPREFARQLAGGGVEISAGRNALQRLLTYVTQENTLARARCVAAPGWHQSCYVLPNGDSHGKSDELFVYQHAGGLQQHYAISGTLEDWKREIAGRCIGNSRLALSVSAMFAGPLQRFVNTTGGGFHLVGGSSSGKTTALRVAASVAGPPEYAREWRSTANGLEGVAVLHNDATLILDELAQIDPRVAGDAAYLLANGSGKSRATRSGIARASARWQIMILSAGEIGLAQHMAEAGKQARAGQSVRLADIPAEVDGGHGVFEKLHDARDGSTLSSLLKDAAQRYHGAAWPLWLEHVARQDGKALANRLRRAISSFQATHLPPNASGEVQRVGERFALAACAGELASKAGLTGWAEGEATTAAATCLRAWIRQRGGPGSADSMTLLTQVRSFFEAHGESRFERLRHGTHDASPVRDRVGYVRSTATDMIEYLVFREAFRRELCIGHDPRRAARCLVDAGWLLPDEARKSTQSIRLPGTGKTRMYVFKAEAIHSG